MGQIGAHARGTYEIEIGYWVGINYSDKGLASNAASALAKALQRSNLNYTIIAECLPHNIPSLRVLEKSGFRRTDQPGHRPGCIRLVFENKD